MQKSLSSVFAFLLLFFCCHIDSVAQANTIVETNFKIGSQYNILKDEFNIGCVEPATDAPTANEHNSRYGLALSFPRAFRLFDVPDSKPLIVNGIEKPGYREVYEVELLKDTASLYDSLYLGVSGKISGIAFTASGDFRRLQTDRLSSGELHLLLVHTIVNALPVTRFRWVKDIGNLETIFKDPDKFYKKCGSHFIIGGYREASFKALISVSYRDQEERDDIIAALNARYGGAQASAQAERSFRDARQQTRVSAKIVQEGPLGRLPNEGDIDAVLKYGREFSDNVLQQDAAGKTVWLQNLAELATYNFLNPDAPEFDSQTQYLADLSDRLTDALTQKANYELVKVGDPWVGRPAGKLDPNAIKGSIGELTKYIQELKRARIECYKEPTQGCKNDELLNRKISLAPFEFVRWMHPNHGGLAEIPVPEGRWTLALTGSLQCIAHPDFNYCSAGKDKAFAKDFFDILSDEYSSKDYSSDHVFTGPSRIYIKSRWPQYGGDDWEETDRVRAGLLRSP
jgi:hypothetical protein